MNAVRHKPIYRVLALALASLTATPALAEPVCRAVEARFTPGAAGLQIVVWIEDINGKYIDTAYITRLTGQFGLANRPGEGLLKTDFRWPYGRREMVAPVWAHRRNKKYPKLMMGGVCGNSPSTKCPDGSACAGDCEDSTIAYHPRVSSYEPFYCSPSGPSKVDAMPCASKGTFAKGAFADGWNNGINPTGYSLYPPRADLNVFTSADHPVEAPMFKQLNDLVAISQATPPPGAPIMPIVWYPPHSLPDGDYVLWVETSQESDFNATHNAQTHPNKADSVKEWDFEGHHFIGQPSVLFRVPFRLDGSRYEGSTKDYAGYSTWDGSDGVLHPPDGTIEVARPGSGAGRLLDVSGARLSVVVGECAVVGDGGVGDGGIKPCEAPAQVTNLMVKPNATSIEIAWNGPTTGTPPARYEVRYHEGTVPITDADFTSQLAPTDPPPAPGAPGARVSTVLRGLLPQTDYTVAVRAVSTCGAPSKVVSADSRTPQQQFTTLEGCFVATAAYGTKGDRSVEVLRRARDRHLVTSPAGQFFVAAYYAASPSFARAIAVDARLRAAARRLLAPLVSLAAQLR